MNYYKRCNSNSSNSSSTSSKSSHKIKHVSKSSTATSPYNVIVAAAAPICCPASTTLLSSTAPSVLSVGIDAQFVPSSENFSNSSHIPLVTTTNATATSSLSSSSSCTASKNHVCSSSQKAAKRKRRSSANQSDKDTELGYEPPLAKRQQRLPSLYQSEPGSVVSSVYPSPIDELVHDIDTHSSSDCISSTATDYDVVHHDDIPDSPNSLQNEHEHACCLPDINETESVDEEYDAVSSTLSTCSNVSSQLSYHQYATLHPNERTPGSKYAQSSQSSSSSATITNTAAPSLACDKPKVKSFDAYVSEHYDCLTPAAEPEALRFCPLPLLAWANANEVWQLMCKKDEHATVMRDVAMLEQHPSLQPRMRAILLDWLMEVCEVYKLHRETYYLAVDYLDRYLSALKKVQKTQLQLIGITCLFVAAKVEEIYPPKIGEFAYVTDGACQDTDILKHEILLLQALEWSISPVTPMSWLGVYMQLNVNNRSPRTFDSATQRKIAKRIMLTAAGSSQNTDNTDDAFIYPQYSGMEFVQTAQLLDLCSLDVGFTMFPYAVIAAAAMSHTFTRETALRCSGFDWPAIEACARWMVPFFEIICLECKYLQLSESNEQIATKFGLEHVCPNIVTDDSHIIQTHTTTMTMFDQVWQLREQYQANALKVKPDASPATGLLICHQGLLTPPASSRKPPVDNTNDNDNDDGDNRENIVVLTEKTS